MRVVCSHLHVTNMRQSGALDRDPQCCVSNLRKFLNSICSFKDSVARHLNIHVASKMPSCHMSNLRNASCHVSKCPSHVTKVYFTCRRVEFQGQGPQVWHISTLSYSRHMI